MKRQRVTWSGSAEEFRQLAINTLLTCYTQLGERIQRTPSEYNVMGTDELAGEYQDLMDAMREFLIALGRGQLSREQFDRMPPVVEHLAAEFSTLDSLKESLVILFRAIEYVDKELFREQVYAFYGKKGVDFDVLAERMRLAFPEGPPPFTKGPPPPPKWKTE